MNYAQANEMAAKFKAIAGFTKINVDNRSIVSRPFGADNTEVDADPNWMVELWSINATAGNRTLEVVKEYTADDKAVALLAKRAKGLATKRDAASLAKISASADRDARGE